MSANQHIRILPEHVINKIAAGEVVERPASVLKELMENALDAGATRIEVKVAVAGRKLVAVGDNGCGMTRDDALLAIERHATSKIRDAEDIERISTLGFRGEALAAIAAVSRMRLTTCRQGEIVGTEVVVVGGKIQDVRDVGCPPGTVVEVRDLFFNVPARRKFLRSQETELGHLRTGFIIMALSHPAIGMTLTLDDDPVYQLAADTSALDRIRELFGSDYERQLRPARHEIGGVVVSGYVGLPSLHRADRNEQYTFVNGRATTAPLLTYAIREGYRTLLPADRHPCVFLFVDLPPDRVDVNVHPAKREVRFREPGLVRDAVIAAIRDALAVPSRGLQIQRPEPVPVAPSGLHSATTAELKIENLPPARAFRYPRLPSPEKSVSASMPPGAQADEKSAPAAAGSPAETSPPSPAGTPWSWCRVLGQIGNLYVVLETEDGLVLMDPHAAHERVLYEKFMNEVMRGQVPTQTLLMPETVTLRPRDAQRVRDVLARLKEMGFGVAEFGGDTFLVDALPACLSGMRAEELLVEVSIALEQAGARGGKERWQEETIARAACRAAVKARDRLRLEEIEQLVVDLARTEMPYTCPHGRPTLVFTSFRELNRKFGRE